MMRRWPLSMDTKMTFPDRRTASVLLTIFLFAIGVALIYSARRILVVFFFALLCAYLLEPVVKFLQRHFVFKKLRGPAVVEVYLAFLILVVVFAHTVVPGIARKTSKALDVVPVLLDGLSTGEIATEIGNKYHWSN